MVRAAKPSRKRNGRLGPPEGYPKDPEKYADPANWKYPVHTPFHARAARRYFNAPRNRAKYAPEEQAYIDRRINAALKQFGIAVALGRSAEGPEAGMIQADVPIDKDIERMTLDELLLLFLGERRMASARELGPKVVAMEKETSTLLSGGVKQYSATVDLADRAIRHDCTDWLQNRAKGKLFCKHLGAFFLSMDPQRTVPLLRRLLRERDTWTFD